MPKAIDADGFLEQAKTLAESILADVHAEVSAIGDAVPTIEKCEDLLMQRLRELSIPVNEDLFEIAYNDEGWLLRDFSWMFMWNHIMRPFFDAVEPKRRGVFLPHCMVATSGCKRESKGIYDSCACCGACSAAVIVREAVRLGYAREHI